MMAVRWVLPDEQPIVWTSRLARRPLAARLPGSALFPPLWSSIVASGRRAMVVAASPATAEQLSKELPGLGVVVPPVFDENDHEQLAAVVQSCWNTIEEVDPEFVFVGISFPKTKLALALIDLAGQPGRSPVYLTLGASLRCAWAFTMRSARVRCSVSSGSSASSSSRNACSAFVTDMKFVPLMGREVARLRRRPDPAGRGV
jgi:hypothetical protein